MKVNVNKATLEELLLLPLNLAEAQAVVTEREKREGFSSMESFLEFLLDQGVKPHEYAAIQQQVTVEHVVTENARIIDF